jgi:ankyrin repeat protein
MLQVDGLDQARMTPLHWAAQKCCISAVKALIVAGADVKKPGKDAWTALRE